MDIPERMGQLHSDSARTLVYTLGGDPMQIIDEWQGVIGKRVPFADSFGGDATITLDDATDGAYRDIVKLAEILYFANMTREAAVAVANAITPVGTLHLAEDVEFSDVSFAKAWSDAHTDQPRIYLNRK